MKPRTCGHSCCRQHNRRMTNEHDALAQSKTFEAAHAAAVAEEAKQEAHEAQLVKVITDTFAKILNDDGQSQPVLIKRIPFICNDIREIKNDMEWIKWSGSGFVATAGQIGRASYRER